MRDKALDVSRCLMNYMIVLLHAWAAFQYVAWNTMEFKFWTFTCSHLCEMAMPCFFLISGYLLFQQYSLSAWPKKMMRRVKRLFVPYVAWNLLLVVFYLGMAHFVPRLALRVSRFGLDTFWGAFSKVLSLTVGPIDGPLWFLRAIFLLALVSPLLYGLMRFWHGFFALGLVIAWTALEPWAHIVGFLHLPFPTYATACFVIGGLLVLQGKVITSFFRSWAWLILGLVACVIKAILVMPTCMSGEPLGKVVNCVVSVLYVVEAPSLIALVAHFPIERISSSKVYLFFKEMSFFAFAGHFLFCSMVLHTVAPFLKFMTVGKMTVLILLFFFVGIAIMSGIYSLGKRMLPKVMKVFDGSL